MNDTSNTQNTAYINHASGSIVVPRSNDGLVHLNSAQPYEYYAIGRINFAHKPMSSIST
jgi:hypothetical protein